MCSKDNRRRTGRGEQLGRRGMKGGGQRRSFQIGCEFSTRRQITLYLSDRQRGCCPVQVHRILPAPVHVSTPVHVPVHVHVPVPAYVSPAPVHVVHVAPAPVHVPALVHVPIHVQTREYTYPEISYAYTYLPIKVTTYPPTYIYIGMGTEYRKRSLRCGTFHTFYYIPIFV